MTKKFQNSHIKTVQNCETQLQKHERKSQKLQKSVLKTKTKQAKLKNKTKMKNVKKKKYSNSL